MTLSEIIRKVARRGLHWVNADEGQNVPQFRHEAGLVVGPGSGARLSRRFEGLVALVTGGGSGLGKATALRLAREGASVLVAGRRLEPLEEVCEAIRESGGRATASRCDVSRAEDCEAAVQKAVSEFGRLDVLVNSAGVHGGGITVVDTEEETWDQVMSVNMKGSFLAVKFAIPEMRKTGAGAIVNVSSICGMRGSNHGVAYGSSKGGVVNMTRYLAVAHAPENIRVNCVCPGVYLSPITEEWLSNPQALAEASQWHPLERIGDVEEVAAAIVFLASGEASFITGAILPVDGGHLAAGRGNP